MTDRSDRKPATGAYASPPCMAHELDPAYFDPLGVDPQQAVDVARWRKAERERLRNIRSAQTVAERARIGIALAGHLDTLVARRFGDIAGRVVSGYWPIKGEPDLRPWLEGLHEQGAIVALPVVETRAAPLVFRRWAPGVKMERGHWNIPVPSASADRVQPEIALSPLVGWDGEGYRLGYGGGYFDRTLAAARPRPFVIGVGLQAARISTIFPQPHDIGMDVIVTEDGPQWEAAT